MALWSTGVTKLYLIKTCKALLRPLSLTHTVRWLWVAMGTTGEGFFSAPSTLGRGPKPGHLLTGPAWPVAGGGRRGQRLHVSSLQPS